MPRNQRMRVSPDFEGFALGIYGYDMLMARSFPHLVDECCYFFAGPE